MSHSHTSQPANGHPAPQPSRQRNASWMCCVGRNQPRPEKSSRVKERNKKFTPIQPLDSSQNGSTGTGAVASILRYRPHTKERAAEAVVGAGEYTACVLALAGCLLLDVDTL